MDVRSGFKLVLSNQSQQAVVVIRAIGADEVGVAIELEQVIQAVFQGVEGKDRHFTAGRE